MILQICFILHVSYQRKVDQVEECLDELDNMEPGRCIKINIYLSYLNLKDIMRLKFQKWYIKVCYYRNIWCTPGFT